MRVLVCQCGITIIMHIYKHLMIKDLNVNIVGQLVLPGMEAHPRLFGVQMAATACLYNLTKGDLAQKIHPRILKQVVELTLTAMETFPNHYQVSSVFSVCYS
jgi:Zyg-11 family protein